MAKVAEPMKVATKSEVIAGMIAELLLGRNVSKDLYNKYVVDIQQDGAALLVEVDDGTSYVVEVRKNK